MRLLAFLCVIALVCCSAAFGEPIPIAEVPQSTPVSFEQDILPILQRSCLACHSASERQGDLVLETPQSLRDGGDSGPAIVPGKGTDSLLLKLAAHQEESFMPPPDNDVNAPKLTSQELGLLRLWIDQGARAGDMVPVPATPQAWQPLSSGLSPVYALALSPDGEHVAVTRANQLYVYHLLSGKLLATLRDSALKPEAAHRDLVQSLAWSSDGSLLASGGFREAKIWRKPRDLQLATVPLGSIATAFAVSPDRKLAATAGANHTVHIWDTATKKVRTTLTGHQGQITDLCFTFDGQRLVSLAQDQTIRFWKCEDGTAIGVLEPPAAVHAIELVPMAAPTEKQPNPPQLLVSGGVDKILHTWSIPELPPRKMEQGAELRQLAISEDGPGIATTAQITAHEDVITALVSAPDQPMQVYSGSLDGKIRRWDLRTGKQLGEYDHGGSVMDLDVHPAGQRLASVSDNHTAKLWDISGKQIAELKGDVRRRNQAALIGEQRDAAAQRLTIVKQRVTTAEEILAKRIEAETAAAEEVVAANAELQQKKMALEQEEAQKTPDKPSEEGEDNAAANEAQQMLQAAEAARKLAEQKYAAAGGAVKAAQEAVATEKKATAETETSLKEVQARLDSANRQVIESERPLRSVRFSPSGDVLATAGDFPGVQLWNAETGAAVGAISEQAASLHPIVFLDDQRLLSSSEKPEAIVWDIDPAWHLERTIGSASQADLISDRVTTLAFDTEVAHLLVGGGAPSRSGELALFHVADGSRMHYLPKAHGDTVYHAAFSPGGSQFVSAGADKHVRLWNMTADEPIKQFEGHTDYVLGVDWKSDAQALVTASGDQTLKVWNVETGDQQRTISGFGKDITAVRYVGDSSHIVSSCGDGLVRLHDADSGKLIRNFAAGIWLHCVEATADGKLIVAGSEDGRLFVWNSADGKQLSTITVGP